MTSKKISSRAGAWLGIISLVVTLAAVAIVSQLYVNTRIDLTRDKQFTLSESALKTLEDLPDIVTLRAVMSRDLPSQFLQVRQRVTDLLREFEARSDGKINLVFEDPGDDPERRQRANALGVQEVMLQEQTRDGMQVKRGYFGLALLYGDKKEVFPVIQNMETFEYELVVMLKRLTGSRKVIGIVDGDAGNEFAFVVPGGEAMQQQVTRGFAENFPSLKREMENLYRVETVNLAHGRVRDDIDLLLVVGPTYLSEREKYRLDQYVMSGRPVIVLTQGMNLSLMTGITARPASSGYEDLLAHYGIGVRMNMILEPRQWESVRFGSSMFPMPYPYWIVVTPGGMSRDNPITATLPSASFPWTSSLEVLPEAQPLAQAEVLVRSSEQSWEETGNLFLYPRELNEYMPVNQQSHALAVLKTGPMTSRYAEYLPEGLAATDTANRLAESRGDARVLVVSNVLFGTDFYVGYTNALGNLHFLMNAVDMLALDPDLIRIRSRMQRDLPLDSELVARAKTPLILANMLLAPLLVLGVGVFMGIRRRKKETKA